MRLRRSLTCALFALGLAFSSLAALAPATGSPATPAPTSVLFVGNSLTYVGNLPAVFTALANANGHPTEVDMLVRGGATLTQWLDSGAVQKALRAGHYNVVVLQERGNDFACGFGPQVCKDARHALQQLAQIARASGAQPILMGTYQVGAEASRALVAAESQAAGANRVPYIDVSDPLNAGREQYPFFAWFAKEGHPGPDLVLLEATLLYQQVHDALPASQPLSVRAPLFVPGSRFAAPDPVSQPLLPAIPLAGGYDYASMEMAAALKLAAPH